MVMYDVIVCLLAPVLSAGIGLLVYRWLNDGRFVYNAARAELLGGQTHVFLLGAAGTGKSRLVSELRSRQPNVVVLAPTALAAHTVGGSTIHSFFKFPPKMLLPNAARSNAAIKDLICNVRTIVVDEISMVRVDLMDAMDRALRFYRGVDEPFGGVRMVFVGDLFQLPPVANDEDSAELRQHYTGTMYYHAPSMIGLTLTFFDLVKVFRQTDKVFSSVLNKIRHAKQRDHDLDVINKRVKATSDVAHEKDVITIVFTNIKAEATNTAALERLSGEMIVSQATYEAEAKPSDVPCENIVRFKVGAQITFINNDPDGRWYNGLIGTITGIESDVVNVTTRYGDKLNVPKVEFTVWEYIDRDGVPERVAVGSATQYPFKLAWAITAHKSQGQTFDRVHIDIDDSKAFADGQMYVALSRCRTLENLTISRKIRTKEIMVNKEALEYLRVLGESQKR